MERFWKALCLSGAKLQKINKQINNQTNNNTDIIKERKKKKKKQ
jgi:hypothetical protein